MHLTFLKPHQVSHYWHTIAPLFAKVITKAVHGEYTLQNLKDMAEAGHYTIGNYFNDMAQLYLANKLAGTANTTPLSQLYNPYGAYNFGTNDTYGGSNS